MIREDLFDVLHELLSKDLERQPAMRFLGKLRWELIMRGFPEKDAEVLAARMHVEIPEDTSMFEIDKLAQTFGQLIDKQRYAYESVGFSNGIQCIVESGSKFSIRVP